MKTMGSIKMPLCCCRSKPQTDSDEEDSLGKEAEIQKQIVDGSTDVSYGTFTPDTEILLDRDNLRRMGNHATAGLEDKVNDAMSLASLDSGLGVDAASVERAHDVNLAFSGVIPEEISPDAGGKSSQNLLPDLVQTDSNGSVIILEDDAGDVTKNASDTDIVIKHGSNAIDIIKNTPRNEHTSNDVLGGKKETPDNSCLGSDYGRDYKDPATSATKSGVEDSDVRTKNDGINSKKADDNDDSLETTNQTEVIVGAPMNLSVSENKPGLIGYHSTGIEAEDDNRDQKVGNIITSDDYSGSGNPRYSGLERCICIRSQYKC